MQYPSRAPVEPARVPRTAMGQAHLSTRVREADLAVVHVAGDDEVEGAGRKAVDEGREMDDEDAQVSLVTPHCEVSRLRPPFRP